jgi:hypothetical protein
MFPSATRILNMTCDKTHMTYDKTHALDLLDWLSLSPLGGRVTSVFGTTTDRFWPGPARVLLF